MATSSRTQRTKSRPARASRPSAGVPSRRTGSRAGERRSSAQSRIGVAGGWIQRRQPEKSGVKKLIGGVGSALPGGGKGRTKSSASAGKAKRGGAVGGLALLAAAAGVALKNRDKITSRFSGDQSNGTGGSAATATTGSSLPGAGGTDVPGPPFGGTNARDTERSGTVGGSPERPGDAGPAA
jgi:hypothetical protein